jgi:hypothetical protein
MAVYRKRTVKEQYGGKNDFNESFCKKLFEKAAGAVYCRFGKGCRKADGKITMERIGI